MLIHICSPAMWYSSQSPLTSLSITFPHVDAITTEVSWISDHITLHPTPFAHQSTVLPRKIPTQELK
jgi:hypothetical protein